MIDYSEFTREDIVGLWNLSRRHQHMHRDERGSPAVFGHEICGGIFLYAGEIERQQPKVIYHVDSTQGKLTAEDFTYRIERYVRPERGSRDWRDRAFAWNLIFYCERQAFWVMRVGGDQDKFKHDWVIMKLHSHLWKDYGTSPV